jgi:hypothetical protein
MNVEIPAGFELLDGGEVRQVSISNWETKYANGQPWGVRAKGDQLYTYFAEVRVLGESRCVFEPGAMARPGDPETGGKPGNAYLETHAPLLVRTN